jgi:serine/threonine protein kinase/serine/threonine protein phosphatase PrpC
MPRCPNPRCQADYPPGTIECTNPFCLCLLPEAIVAGRYRIETLMGIGGMGAVYRASDTFEMEQVALKVLTFTNSTLDRDTAVERFRREARYAHQLKHQNVVPVLNFGQDGKLLYLVMPLVTGGTVKSLLQGECPLPTPQAQRYLNDLAAAIDAIHQHPQQIVHRDIKPSNLLIHQKDGRLVVTDFGIARAMQQEKALTQRGWSLGTQHYIAPEQGLGKAEPASDIYAMGVVAYQMFTGLLPFQAVVKSRGALLPTPSTLNPSLPPTVDPIIMRAIDIDPTKRYPSGQEFADALNKALQAENQSSISIAVDTIIPTGKANIVIHSLIPEHPCSRCGRENRSISRFCRYCGYSLNDSSALVTDVCQVGYMSDIGQQAKDNEDMLLIAQGLCVAFVPPRPFSLFAVADGLLGAQGKPAGGHKASRLAIETISDVILPLLTTASATQSRMLGGQSQLQVMPPPETVLAQWMRDAVRQANQVIYHRNADYDATMASTLTTILLYKRHLFIASVGDSRAYYYNQSKGLQCITTDHTLAANLVKADLLLPDDIYKSPKRNQHYRYLGQNYHVVVDLFQCEVEAEDSLLLCTDGLWHMVRNERIQEILVQGGDPQKLAHILVYEANNAGGEGNISAIVIRVK